MVISKDSQLGLRFIYDIDTKVVALKLIESKLTSDINSLENNIKLSKKRLEIIESYEKSDVSYSEEEVLTELAQYAINSNDSSYKDDMGEIRSICGIDRMFCYDDKTKRPKYDGKVFLIQESVYLAAELIKIGTNFTGRILKDVKAGDYMYLMGKHQMCRFVVSDLGIKGIFFDDKSPLIFEWGVYANSGEYFFTKGFDVEFSTIMQILTFIELGDIEVKILKSLQNNGEKKDAKIYNATNNTVYLVDSSWNQLIIRTEGFAVRGHFKLQPCGPGMIDRKLIWINAYEKDGYIRRPKASILNK